MTVTFSWRILMFVNALYGVIGHAPAAEIATTVQAERIVERHIQIHRTFVGTTMPPRRSVIGSAVDGRIVELLVREGEAVQTGQVLARLRTGTLQIELRRAQAEHDLRNQELLELDNGSRPEEIDRAKAIVNGVQAKLDYTTKRLQRARRTYENGEAVTLDQLEEAISQSSAAKQDLIAAQADYEMARKGPRQEKIAQATARVAVQLALIRQIEDRIALHTLKAPFDGYVVVRHNEVGGWAMAGKPVVEMIELNPIEIEVFVSEDFVTHVHRGMSATISIEALQGKHLTGEVVYVVPQADLRSRTFPVKIQLTNPIENDQPLIKAGMFARVTLSSESQQKRMLVPKDSLVLQGEQRLIYLIQPANNSSGPHRVRPVPVELGVAEGEWIEISGNIKAGELVVVKGNERLRPQQTVSIAP